MTERRPFRPRLIYSADAKADRLASVRAEQFRQDILPHMDAAYSYARYLTRDPSRAEDIVQEAFLRAFRGFNTWRGDNPRSWLFAIVRNCFLAVAREPRWQALDGSETAMAEAVEYRHPEAIVADASEAAMLRQTIADLPPPFRETLVLRELEELSYKEIASLTNVPIGTVMSRLARARAMLMEVLLPRDQAQPEARQ